VVPGRDDTELPLFVISRTKENATYGQSQRGILMLVLADGGDGAKERSK